jgi:hypothetical protein
MEEANKTGEKITSWTSERLSRLVGMNLPDKKEETVTPPENIGEISEDVSTTDDEFNKSLFVENPVESATKQTLSSNPYAKFLGVALPVAGIFFVVGILYTLVSGGVGNKKTTTVATPTPTPTAAAFTADSETGNLKTEVALGTQAQQINALEESKKKSLNSPGSTPNVTPTPTPTIISTPRPRLLTTSSISSTTPNQTRELPTSSNPQPPLKIQPKLRQPTLVRSRVTPANRQVSVLPTQPTQRPIQPIQPRTISRITPTQLEPTRPRQIKTKRTPLILTKKRPTKTLLATRLPQLYPSIPINQNRYSQPPGREELASLLPPNQQTTFQKPKSISYGTISYTTSTGSENSKNNISNKVSSESTERDNLLRETPAMKFRAGSYASANLYTPVFYLDQKGASAGNVNGNGLDKLTYSLKLTEDLKGVGERIVIPTGSLVILKATSINASGLVNLSVVSYIYNDREYPLPSEMFSVRGAKNKPLLASKINTGDNLTAPEIREAVYASLAKIGDVLTRPSGSTTISNGTASTTQTSGGGSTLGAALSGGFNAILKRESDSNNRIIEANVARPQLWYLQEGTKVNLYVDKSFNI